MKNRIKKLILDPDSKKFKLNQKVSIFVACLTLSTAFWLLSALSKDYVTTLQLPIQYQALSNDFVLTEAPPESINLQVKASGFHLIGEQWALNKQFLPIDLNSAKPHYASNRYFLRTVELRNKIVQNIDNDLNLRFISPDTLYFSTEQRIGKTVPIRSEFDLSFKPGYRLRDEIKLIPDSIYVSGPESYIDTLRAYYLETITHDKIEDSIMLDLKLGGPEKVKEVIINPSNIKVSIPVEKFTEKQITLPLTVDNQSTEISLKTFPDEVQITFLVPLSMYENLDPSVVKAEVIFEAEMIDQKKLKVELTQTVPFAEVVKIEPDHVEFIITK